MLFYINMIVAEVKQSCATAINSWWKSETNAIHLAQPFISNEAFLVRKQHLSSSNKGSNETQVFPVCAQIGVTNLSRIFGERSCKSL